MLRSFLYFTVLAAAFGASQGYIAAPLIGYGQGLTLRITPGASTNEQCSVYGVPTASGYADPGAGPLYLYTPKNTGVHVLQFVYSTDNYNINPVLVPGQASLTIDATNQQNPLISFDATRSQQGQQSAIYLYLSDKGGNPVCNVQIQLTVDAILSCAPTYGGIVLQGGGSGFPQGAGTFVIPGGTVYAPVYVTNIIIQQFVQITNINIQNIVVNVVQITNVNVVNNIVVNVPPTPAPVNCTATPTNSQCARPPTPVVTPSRGPAAPNTTVTPLVNPPVNPPATLNAARAPPTPPPAQNTFTAFNTAVPPARGPTSGRRFH